MHIPHATRADSRRPLLAWLCAIVALGSLLPRHTQAAVIVIANRTKDPLEFEIRTPDGKQRSHRLEPSQCDSIFVSDAVTLHTDHDEPKSFELRPNAIYFFGRNDEGQVFEEIGFSTPLQDDTLDPLTEDTNELTELPDVGIVNVRILIDDELNSRQDPELALRERLLAASRVFERAARIRFDVIAVEQWESVDRVTDFETLLVDFERKVAVKPGELAIGFSQQASRSKTRLGGTRLPLHSHILVRERGQRPLSERGQLEVLVHELGHYLGAVHSPEWSSVMRPKLGDGLAGSGGYRIGLDPVNTMIVALVGEEVRAGSVRAAWELSPAVKTHLRRIYADLDNALPDDSVAHVYRKVLDLKSAPAELPASTTPLARHARHVLLAVAQAAERNVQLSDKSVAGRYGDPHRIVGDELTEHYVRTAAVAAQSVPEEYRPHAFVLGLAVAMDSTTQLRDHPITRFTWRSIESDREFQFRKGVLGQPTLRGRTDLTLHFAISAGLAALSGPRIAEAAGVWKEHTDGKFSRADYSADLAGIQFFEHLKANPEKLNAVAETFSVADYVPLCEELAADPPETDQQGSAARANDLRSEILREIEQLPGFAIAR